MMTMMMMRRSQRKIQKIRLSSLFSPLVSLHRFVQAFLFSSPLVSDGQACFHKLLHCILHHRTSLFSRTPKRQCLCECMCVSLSTRLFPSFSLSLSRSLALSPLSSSFASQRGSVWGPKRSVYQKQRRRQKDSGFKLLLGTRGGGGGFPTAF